MIRVSSRQTFYYKKIFPVFWFSLLAVFIGLTLFGSRADPSAPVLLLLVIPLIMAGFGFILMKYLIFDLVDDVYDDGDALIVKNGDYEDRIALANIINVSTASFTHPRRVTLMLRSPYRFGSKIVFIPELKWSDSRTLWMQNSYAEALVRRIDDMRRKA